MIQLGKPRLRRLADSLFVYINGGLCIYVYIYTHIHKQLKIELFEGYLSKMSQTIDCKVPNLGCTDVLLLLQWDVTKCLLIHGSSAQIDPKVRWMWVYAWLGVSTTYIRKQIHLIIQLIT